MKSHKYERFFERTLKTMTKEKFFSIIICRKIEIRIFRIQREINFRFFNKRNNILIEFIIVDKFSFEIS